MVGFVDHPTLLAIFFSSLLKKICISNCKDSDKLIE